MDILYLKSYEYECQIIIVKKPRISVAFVQDIYHIRYFLQKGKLNLRSLLSGLLTPVTFYRYFRRLATFEGSLLGNFMDIPLSGRINRF